MRKSARARKYGAIALTVAAFTTILFVGITGGSISDTPAPRKECATLTVRFPATGEKLEFDTELYAFDGVFREEGVPNNRSYTFGTYLDAPDGQPDMSLTGIVQGHKGRGHTGSGQVMTHRYSNGGSALAFRVTYLAFRTC